MSREVDACTLDIGTARARIDRIAAHVAASRQDIIDAHANRDWLALGYGSWSELCEAEFRGAMLTLPRGERQEVVAELTDAGMSTRAIGAALGVGDATVRRDQAGASNGAPAPAPVTGLDGKTYTRPTRTVTVVEEVTVDAETGEIVDPRARLDAASSDLDAAMQDIEGHPFVAEDPGYRLAVLRRDIVRQIPHIVPPVDLPPDDAAAALIGHDDVIEALGRARRELDAWHDQLDAALTARTRLRLVGTN